MRRARRSSSLASRSLRRLASFQFVAKLFEPLEDRRLLASDSYVEFNLASNQAGAALVTNPSLGYGWGISTSPGASGAFSVSDTSAARSNSYSGDVSGSPFADNADQTVYVPLATGQVYNGNANEFVVHSPNPPPGGTNPIKGGPAEFLYASLDGTIYGFNANIGPHAVPAVSVPGAVFTGLTIANSGTASTGDRLYAADFLEGKIDVFDASFQPVTTSGSFTDPNLPAGYKPFNVEALGGDLYVSYTAYSVLPNATAEHANPPIAAQAGVVDAFDASGNFLGRIASGSPLDQPWGMAIAPQSFGQYAGDLLVANHGDGKINVFDPTPSTTATAGTSLGTLSGADGKAFIINGLLGLSFGNGDNAGDSGSLYFTAGTLPILPPGAGGAPSAASALPALFTHGLVGTIQVAGTDPLVAVGTNTMAQTGEPFSGALAAFGSADLPSPAANPVATYRATIDWGDGSSITPGTVVPTGNGGFLVVGSHTYSAAGTDDYQVTIQDASGNSVAATGTVVVSAPGLVAHAVPVVSQQLAIGNAIVAGFVDTGGGDPLSNYTATIDWGDGSSSTGTVNNADPLPGSPISVGFYSVAGSHTYAATGGYALTIAIQDADGSQATIQGTIEVVQATLLAHSLPVHGDGLSVSNANVATFTDTGGSDPLANYSATIDWGDGSTSSGTVGLSQVQPASPISLEIFTVAGSHAYAATGDYTFTVTISDTDGSHTTVQGTVDVAQATLMAQALPIVSNQLAIDNSIVAWFDDTGGSDPLTNYAATIDWGDGSTSAGTVFNADPPGASVGFYGVRGSHTYASKGDYTFTVTIDDTDGASATAQGTADVAQATLVAHALPVKSDGLTVNNAAVAGFTDTGGADPLGNYSATIDWGDGSTSTGTIGNGPTPAGTPTSVDFFTVAGSHAYSATGDYTFTVTISDTDGSNATVQGKVDVAQATLEAHAQPVHSDGLSVSNASVATFTDTGGADLLANYSATIDWGDGSTSTGTIGNGPTPAGTPVSVDFFTVAGSHTYAATGDYTFTVTISDTDGSNATVQGKVDVAQATLVAHALPVVSQGLSVNDAKVAGFIDTGGADPLTNYSATIDWGDGSSSTGTVGGLLTPAGTALGESFSVSGGHTYAATGDYTFTVTISDTDGSQTTVQGSVDVAQATLVAHALPIISNQLAIDNLIVASFDDTGGGDPLTNYTATIDWGDGSTSAGTVFNSDPPSGASVGFYAVRGSHTYASKGDYTFTVTISDTDGTSATAQGTADMGQAPLLAVGVPVVVTSGLAVNGAIVSAFTDAGGGDSPSNYSATIDWGDGSSTTAGTVTGSGNSFVVTGSHTYAAAGDYQLKVTIADQDGSSASAQSHAFIDSSVASFVVSAFENVLHRAADDTGLSYWTQQIGGGLAPSQFASDLTHSAEYYATNVIGPDYQRFLGRAADATGVTYWTNQMQQGLTDQELEADFIASPEFYAQAGGTNSSWVNAMYEMVLGRSADTAGLNYWLAQLAAGESRSSVALGFAASQEHQAQLVQNDYFTYLGRSAGLSEVDYWVAQFENGATNEDVVSGFVGSSEYVKLHS